MINEITANGMLIQKIHLCEVCQLSIVSPANRVLKAFKKIESDPLTTSLRSTFSAGTYPGSLISQCTSYNWAGDRTKSPNSTDDAKISAAQPHGHQIRDNDIIQQDNTTTTNTLNCATD